MSNDENYLQYTRDIARTYRRLTAKEERSLGRRVRKGDEAAVTELVEANLPFVMHIAKRYFSPGMTRSDIIQEGNLGLVEAARTFKYWKGVRFCSYASWGILKRIRRALEKKSGIVHLPTNFFYEHRRLMRELEESKKLGSAFKSRRSKYAKKEGVLSPENYDFKYTTLDRAYTLHSSDDKAIAEVDNLDEIEKLMSILTEDKCMLIEYAFGIHGRPKLSTKEIGSLLGISQRKASNRVTRALAEMWFDWSRTKGMQAITMPDYLKAQRFLPYSSKVDSK